MNTATFHAPQHFYSHFAPEPWGKAAFQCTPLSDAHIVSTASHLAEFIHRGDYRKNGLPFITHPMAVWRTALAAGVVDARIQAAAWLHDVAEERPECAEQLLATIASELCPQISAWVRALTDDMQMPREERKAAQLARLIHAPQEVQVVKLADRLVNLTEPGLAHERVRAMTVHTWAMLRGMAQERLQSGLRTPLDAVQLRLTRALRLRLRRVERSWGSVDLAKQDVQR